MSKQKKWDQQASARSRGHAGARPGYGHRQARRSVAVVVEGEKTEKTYLDWLNRRVRGVQIQTFFDHSSPEKVVGRALRERASGERDAVWVFVDVDEHHHLQSALATAQNEGISVALSGLCFETWLLMHLAPQTRAYASGDDEKRAWKQASGGPDLSEEGRLARVSGLLQQALKNAAQKRAQDCRDGVRRERRNPSTEVDLFIQEIAELVHLDPNTLYG